MEDTIIHVFNDDKFIDPAIKLFEGVCPNRSEYYVLIKENEPFKYVKSPLVKRLDLANEKDKTIFLEKIHNDLRQILFFHALDDIKQQIVLSCPEKIRKVWFIWGYDLYNNWGFFKNNVYENKTTQLIKKKIKLKDKLVYNDLSFFIYNNTNWFKYFLPLKIIKVLNNNFETRFFLAAKLMDVVVPVVPTEYALIQKMKLKAKFAPFTYGCVEDLLGDSINKNVYGQKNILVGNSADPSNNHIEIFLKLAKLHIGDRKVYVPLSYGGNDKYKIAIIELGTKLFGDNFVPLTTFMSLDHYNKILLSCGIIVFNHKRQQGVGNIITMGYLGAKLFLNNESPVYSYYKKIGLNVFTINQLNDNQINKSNQELYFNNSTIFKELYSEKAVHQKIKELLLIVSRIK